MRHVNHRPQPQSVSRPTAPLAIDLFAGAGGLSRGFRDAGFRVIQAIERDPNAYATYTTNHPDTDVICADIRDLDPDRCLQRIGCKPGDITIVIGGPPCQGFSESNRRTRTLDNPRNHLYRHFLRFVEHIAPQWIVMENVAGLRTMAKGLVLDDIIASLAAVGYHADYCILNAVQHRVPQIRRRLFVIANRLHFPIPGVATIDVCDNLVPVTVRDAISDLPRLSNGASANVLPYRTEIQSTFQAQMRSADSTHVSGNLVTRNALYILQRYKHIPQGGNWRNIPLELLANYRDVTRCHTGIYHRLAWDEPSKVIGNFRKNMLIHPEEDRGLSIREAARLQGFRDDYDFRGSIGFCQQQVADAVPPMLAQVVGNVILANRRSTATSTSFGKPCATSVGRLPRGPHGGKPTASLSAVRDPTTGDRSVPC